VEIEQLEIDLWHSLETARQFPETLEVRLLCDALEQVIQGQPIAQQLEIASTAMTQLTEVYAVRAEKWMTDWQRRHDPQEPVVALEQCVDLFVQSLHLEISDLFEPPDPTHYPTERRSPTKQSAEGTIVGRLDQEALLQALDQQMSQHSGMTEMEAFNTAISVAHGEDIRAWSEAINQFFSTHTSSMVCLSQLQQTLNLPVVAIWLGLLLGNYVLEQRGEFYDMQSIFVQQLPTPIAAKDNSIR
jgi:hypothetical protein